MYSRRKSDVRIIRGQFYKSAANNVKELVATGSNKKMSNKN